MAFTHPSCSSSVCLSLGTLHKQSSGSVERTHQSRDPEGCTYQSSDPEGYTYQSSDPEGYTYQSSDPEECIYQSSDLEGYTYQSSDPEGCTYQSSDPKGYTYHANRIEGGRRRTGTDNDWVSAADRWSGMRSRQPARMHKMKRGIVGDGELANRRMTDLKDRRRLAVRGRKTRLCGRRRTIELETEDVDGDERKKKEEEGMEVADGSVG
ncbi:NBS-LRR type resistance protein [Cucumis melo var. makuwa]|uniref:NBS-LRR type resistance protein n=1 Tax=Cucumis melo var. makuwa TaxID=1194695 RepID=A0A5A7TBS3_CUCMM|nr:NBS-LRR type resistance protein [Cucumis melo var. makuwa]